MTLHVRVQVPGSARGEDEIEYWRRRSCGSIARNALKRISIFGNRSSRSKGLTLLSLISALKLSPFSRSSSSLADPSEANLIIASMFYNQN